MSSKNGTDPTTMEGRLFDGSAYGIRLADGSTIRVCDFAGPEGVWAKIEQARKDDGFVTFTGARATSGGKLEGFVIIRAKLIDAIHSFGPGLMGITEARLAAVEAEISRIDVQQANVGERLTAVEDGLDDLEGEDDLPEGEGVAPVITLPSEVPVAEQDAMAAAAAEDE